MPACAVRACLVIGVCLLQAGCQLGYYSHLARGHLGLMHQRAPLADWLGPGELAGQLAEPERLQLARVPDILAFAEAELQLDAHDSYQSYVHLDRPWVVWNLFAAPEFSLAPRRWCFPVAGCTSYRGYFDQGRAERDAARLKSKGLDVYGAGAIAYSTLGWFRDPLVTPMLAGSADDLVELLLHELVHQRFYLKGDTRFNESLATAVAAEGLRHWRQANGQPEVAAGPLRQDSYATVLGLVMPVRAQLEELYAQPLSKQQMRAQKQQLQIQLRTQYQAALASSPGLAAWQRFFDGPLNNAQLNTLADYNGWVPGFAALIRQCAGDWPCFWRKVEALAALPPAQRQEQLAGLASAVSRDHEEDQ